MTYASRLSKFLPPSLGTLFAQPVDLADTLPTTPLPPSDLPGGYAAPELCTIVDQYREDLVRPGSVAEVKLDGIRCLYVAGRLWTREGSTFEAAEHCLPALRAIEAAYGIPMFFDGEYVEDGGLESTIAAFRRGKGDGALWLFDAVPFDQWLSGRPSRQVLTDRKARLKSIMSRVAREGGAVGYIEHYENVTPGDVETFAQDLWRKGYEGVVVKNGNSFYHRKRTCDWMKVKLRTVSKMMVVDIAGCQRKVCVRGTDEMRDQAKHLIVRLPGVGSPTMKLTVTGGLAETLWERRGDVVGSYVDVEHCGFTGGGQPREAVLKSVTL